MTHVLDRRGPRGEPESPQDAARGQRLPGDGCGRRSGGAGRRAARSARCHRLRRADAEDGRLRPVPRLDAGCGAQGHSVHFLLRHLCPPGGRAIRHGAGRGALSDQAPGGGGVSGELRAVLQQWAGHAAPAPASPLDDVTSHALHESALARKIEDKIAQLEAANRKLQESEARFRSLAEMSSDFYWESDAGHRLTQHGSAGKNASTVSGFERGTHIGERRWEHTVSFAGRSGLAGAPGGARCAPAVPRVRDLAPGHRRHRAPISRSAAIRCSMPPARSRATAASAPTSPSAKSRRSVSAGEPPQPGISAQCQRWRAYSRRRRECAGGQ